LSPNLFLIPMGLVHVYTGDGKGKTTAALGLALRVVGAGGRVYFAQFLKSPEAPCSEMRGVEVFGESFIIERFPGQFAPFTKAGSKERLKDSVEKALHKAGQILKEGKYDLVVLDEIFIVLKEDIIDEESLIRLLEERAENVEVVLTGRYAPERIIEYADLVTECRNVKHPYDKGLPAREGIDY